MGFVLLHILHVQGFFFVNSPLYLGSFGSLYDGTPLGAIYLVLGWVYQEQIKLREPW